MFKIRTCAIFCITVSCDIMSCYNNIFSLYVIFLFLAQWTSKTLNILLLTDWCSVALKLLLFLAQNSQAFCVQRSSCVLVTSSHTLN